MEGSSVGTLGSSGARPKELPDGQACGQRLRGKRHESPLARARWHGGLRMQAYTVEQVAELLHIGRDKVYYLLRTGQLRSMKIGKLRRITDRHLAEFIASHEEAI